MNDIVRMVYSQGGADPALFENGWEAPDWAAITKNGHFHARPHSRPFSGEELVKKPGNVRFWIGVSFA
jgi:hypothetical protein